MTTVIMAIISDEIILNASIHCLVLSQIIIMVSSFILGSPDTVKQFV